MSLDNKLTQASWYHNPRLYLGYDAPDRLHTVRKGAANVTPDARYVWNGGHLAGELDGSTGAFRRGYVHGPGVDEVVGVWAHDRPGNVELYHADERGSIVAVTDRWGTNVARTGYGDYGQTADLLWPLPFGYTGQVYLREAKLYHYKARAYEPDWGRFVQADPIGYGGGANLYAYVGGDPVNLTDPSGLKGEGPNPHVKPVDGGRSGGLSGTGPRDIVGGPHNGGQGNLGNTGHCCYAPGPGNTAVYVGNNNYAVLASASAGAGGSGGGNGEYASGATSNNEVADIVVVARKSTPGLNVYVPASQVPINARGILQERALLPDGRVVVMLDSKRVGISAARNGRGAVYTARDGSGLRVMLPKPGYPQGYTVYFNNQGQPISPYSGRTGSLDETHYHIRGFLAW